MTAETRHEVLGLRLGVGDHICGFYRKPAERDDILIPFLVEGLKAGDKCTCVVDSCTPGRAVTEVPRGPAPGASGRRSASARRRGPPR